MNAVGVILLAAGGSTRMGRPKQLLPFRGTTLLRHAAGVVAASGLRPAVVVLGPEADRMASELHGLPVAVVANPDWACGIGTSVRVGVRAALDLAPDLAAAVLTLADLPLVTPALLGELADEHRAGGRPIVACRYGGTVGVPALFARGAFAALQSLPDGDGAKHLIRAAGAALGTIDFPDGAADIDTPAEYDRLAAGGSAAAPERQPMDRGEL